MEIKSQLATQIEKEIKDYLQGQVNISEGVDFSQKKLIDRIGLFQSRTYPTGKFDLQGNYKYWFDKISSCINAEVKNIDIDTKNIKARSDRKIDELPTIIVNLKMKDWLRDNGQSEEINSAVEEGSGWGNVVWKKVKNGYERVDLKNFYIINQTAKNLTETPTIERHQLSQTDLKGKDKWKHIDEVIKECKNDSYKSTIEGLAKDTTTPYYEIYERNGEVCLADLKEYRNEDVKEGDEDKYLLAKVIGAGMKGNLSGVEIKYILYANTITKMPFKEFHRSAYKGRWWREGLYELLFDIQVRLNQIGNQIAQGLELAAKHILISSDKLIVQSILTDMNNGDIIRAKDLAQVNLRMEAFDQLANEWNRLIQMANDTANSQEVVMGTALSSGTPLGAYNRLNTNANKLFGFIQEKLAIPFSEIFKEWLIPEMVDELKADDIVNLTGDSEMLNRVKEIIIDDWYLRNLLAIGPHTNEMGMALKTQKIEEMNKRPQLLMSGMKDLFDGFKKNVYVSITGEADTIDEDTQSLVNIIGLEQDPIRRSVMLDMILKSKGFDVTVFPKPQLPQPIQQSQPIQQQPKVALTK